jgi:probable rRNA maturation factor
VPSAPDITVDVSASRGYGSHRVPVRRLAREILSLACEGPSELSVALVGDAEMRRLNATYRGKDRPTDVLSFSQREGESPGVDSALLGDVVISVPTAARQAHERGTELERELAELLAHGILHLLGYDHERSAADARRMFARQREILAQVEDGAWNDRGRSRKDPKQADGAAKRARTTRGVGR